MFLVALPGKRTIATVRTLGPDKLFLLSWSLPACWKRFEYLFNEFPFSPSKKCLKEYLSSLSLWEKSSRKHLKQIARQTDQQHGISPAQ